MKDFTATGSKNITVLGAEELDNVVGGRGGRHHLGGGNRRNGGFSMRGRGGNQGGNRGDGRRGDPDVVVIFIDARTIINVANNVV